MPKGRLISSSRCSLLRLRTRLLVRSGSIYRRRALCATRVLLQLAAGIRELKKRGSLPVDSARIHRQFSEGVKDGGRPDSESAPAVHCRCALEADRELLAADIYARFGREA